MIWGIKLILVAWGLQSRCCLHLSIKSIVSIRSECFSTLLIYIPSKYSPLQSVVPIENPGFPLDSCTVATCSLKEGQIFYQPNLGGNGFYIAIFTIALLFQIVFGIWYRTGGFPVGMFCGLVLEIVGYAARLQMHYNPFPKGTFDIYLVTLTIGPTFLTTPIYLCLARIIVIFGEGLSRFKPRIYTSCFIFSDGTSLIVQATGGAIASGTDTHDKKQTGIHVMVAGLALQVISRLVFMALCSDFALAIRKSSNLEYSTFVDFRNLKKLKAFLWSLGFATLLVFIHSCFRVAELSESFASNLANNEVTFMVLEGGMVTLAAILLTPRSNLWPGGLARCWMEFLWKARLELTKTFTIRISLQKFDCASDEVIRI